MPRARAGKEPEDALNLAWDNRTAAGPEVALSTSPPVLYLNWKRRGQSRCAPQPGGLGASLGKATLKTRLWRGPPPPYGRGATARSSSLGRCSTALIHHATSALAALAASRRAGSRAGSRAVGRKPAKSTQPGPTASGRAARVGWGWRGRQGGKAGKSMGRWRRPSVSRTGEKGRALT